MLLIGLINQTTMKDLTMHTNEVTQYYENGMPYKPLYDGFVEGFRQNTGFKPTNKKNEQPMILIISITELIYTEILDKYKKLNLQKYIISPDYTEIWLIFDHYYIRVTGITTEFKESLIKGDVQCIVACKGQPIIIPFELK